MLVIHQPSEHVSVEIGESAAPVSAGAYIAYVERRYIDVERWKNEHYDISASGHYDLLSTNKTQSGTTRTIYTLTVHNSGEASFPVLVGMHNEIFVPIADYILPPKATLSYAEGAGWTVFPSTILQRIGSTLVFGADSIGAQADTRYLYPGYANQTASANSIGLIAPRDGVLRNLTARHNSATGNGSNVTYRVRINQMDTPLVCTVPTSAVANGLDDVHSAAVQKGQLIEVTATKASSLGNGGVQAVIAMQYTAEV